MEPPVIGFILAQVLILRDGLNDREVTNVLHFFSNQQILIVESCNNMRRSDETQEEEEEESYGPINLKPWIAK